MNKKHYWTYILTLVAIILAAFAPGIVGAQTREEWVRIQNGSQGYVLDCPKFAIVRRYDPEGILQIVLPVEHQVMMVRVHDDLANLGLGDRQSIAENDEIALTQVVRETFGSSAKINRLSQISVGGSRAVTAEWSGASRRYRLTILLAGDRVFSINYPLGQPENEMTFEHILETFSPTRYSQDKGFEVIQTGTETVNDISVPHYYQNDSRWVCDRLGDCVNCDACGLIKCTCPSQPNRITIGDAGCAITSYAMIFEYYTTSHYKTPLELDTCYTTHGEYGNISGCGYCGRHWWNLNQSVCKPSDVTYVSETLSQSVVDGDLQAGHPLMGELPGHYVVVTGKSGSNYNVNDPVIGNPSQRAFGDFTNFVRFRGPSPDSVPPTTSRSLSGTSGDNGWYTSNVQVTLSASDNSGGSGVKLIQYRIDGGSWHTYSSPFTISGDGSHTVRYKAQDNASNWESEKQVSIRIDATDPTGSLTINDGATTARGVLVQVGPSASDATSGVYQLRLRDAGGAWSDWQACTASTLWQLPASTGQTHTVEIQFKDRAGNTSATYSHSIYLDVYPARPSSVGYRLARSTWGAAPWDKQSANYRLQGTVGQPSMIGILSSANYRLSSGYWTMGYADRYTVYLPLVVRNN